MFSPDLFSKCVKRHMNINFKTNLVAMLALASATALGSDSCLGMQDSANFNMAVGTGIVKPRESSHAGAFGAVAPAPDTGHYYRANNPPPIVSAPQEVQQRPLATSLSSPNFQRNKSVMLSPIESKKPMIATPAIDSNMAPPTIIKASNAFGHDADGSKVAQAAQWGPDGYVRTATSSAGVPLYPRSAPPAPPKIRNQPPKAAYHGVPPIISADSLLVSPNNSIAPVSSVAALPPNPAPAATTPAKASTIDPSYDPAPSTYSQGSGSTSFAQGSGSTSFAQGSGSTSFAQGSGSTTGFAPTAASPQYFSGTPVEAPVISGPPATSGVPAPSVCGDCAGGGCSGCGVAVAPGGAVTSNCQSCGNNGCYNAGQIASRAGISGLVPAARRYLIADALFYTRTDGDDIVNSNFGTLDGFDFEGGLRLTFGAKSDSLRGREVTYKGIAPVEEFETRTSAGGFISLPIFSTGGLPAAATSAFQNVTNQTESQSAEFHSLEFNRVTYGWDVIKSFSGFRYIYAADDYQTITQNALGETGDFQLQTFNNLFGVQIGGEIFYDVGRRLSYSFESKAGLFANFSQVDTRLTNNGIEFINADDDNATFSTLLEFSALGHYQLSETARFRLGYNVLFLGEVATSQRNFDPVLTPTSASSGDDGDDVVFHGLNFGLEIFR